MDIPTARKILGCYAEDLSDQRVGEIVQFLHDLLTNLIELEKESLYNDPRNEP